MAGIAIAPSAMFTRSLLNNAIHLSDPLGKLIHLDLHLCQLGLVKRIDGKVVDNSHAT